MDIRKYQFNIFCLLLFPLSATGQEWNKQDSLRLQQMLESDQEIKINRKFIEKVEQNMYSRKPFVDFDPTLLNPEKPDVPLNKNDAFQKVQKRHVQEKR